MSGDFLAEIGRRFHPLRFTRWAASDLNPAVWWLKSAAEAVTANRQPVVTADQPLRRSERFVSEMISASFDLYRDLRDAASEAAFFLCYGNMFLLNPPDASRAEDRRSEPPADPRTISYVQDALQAIDKGGYVEAVARAAYMLQHRDEPLPVWRLQLRKELAAEYRDLLPDVPQDEWQRVRGQQEIITRFEPERAMASLSTLLSKPEDRRRFVTLLDRLLADERVQPDQATPQQHAALARIREVLGDGVKSRAAVKSNRLAK